MSLFRVAAFVVIILAFGILIACSNSSGVPSQPTSSTGATALANVNSVSIAPEIAVFRVGQAQQFTVEADLGSGVPPSSPLPLWVSSNPTILIISANGLATALAVGDATVKVTFLGHTATRRVQIVAQ